MGITEGKKGLRKSQRINFTWTINDYNIATRYTNKADCGKTIIKMLMEPVFINGKVEGASPFIMFDSVEGIEKSPKEFSFVIRHGIKCESSFGFIWPLKLKQRYSAGPGIFLEAYNYSRFLDLRKNLILEFEIQIVNQGFEKDASFDDTKYAKDLQNIFDNKSFCDCEFDVNGSTIPAHKFVISARAPKLLKAIEDAGNKLSIENGSIEGFIEFLRYLYCAKLADKSDATVFDVLGLAHAYDVQYLKQFCEEILKNNLTALNANSVYQNAHKYDMSDDLKQKSFALIQEMFKSINQKLPDDFINDPKYVDNLITLAESLINGLKKKELLINEEQAFIQASPSVQQMKVESAINEIYKEAESLNDGNQIDAAEDDDDQIDDTEPDEDMTEFNLMEDYVQNMSEIIDEDFEYEEFAENVPEITNDRYLDVIIEEDILVTTEENIQAIMDESEANKTFEIESDNLEPAKESDPPNKSDECALKSEDTTKIVDIDVKASDDIDQAEGIVKDDTITEIQKDMQNIEKFIIKVTDEVGTVVENICGPIESDTEMDDCCGTDKIVEQAEDSVPADNIKVEIQIIENLGDLKLKDEKFSETADVAQKEV